MKNEIPIVVWSLDDLLGELRRISLVSEPAIEQDFMLFSSTNEMKFKAIDEQKRIITGCCMRPNIKIKRYDEDGRLYYGTFSEDVVRQAAQLFFKKGSNINNTNLEHEIEVDGIWVFESWIVEDDEKDKAVALGFGDVRKGDWFVSMKVENDVVWNNYLKTGLIRGFSIEIRAAENEVDTIEMIKAVVNSKKEIDWKWQALETIIEAKPYVDETGEIEKEKVSGLENFESYNDYPKEASENACKVLRWRDEFGDDVKGMTRVGWVRANQLCNREPISEETIARMSAFRRHRKNAEISEEYKGTPWKDAGYVAWLGWGGDAGVEWSVRKLEEIRNSDNQ